MKILVTGGTGLVGLNLVRRLAAAGNDVRVLVRPSKRPRLGLDDVAVERVAGDVTDEASVRAAVAGVEAVFHVAALTWQGPWAKVRRQMEAVNVGGTEIVCRAAKEAGVRRLVHTSSTVAVGHGTVEQPCDEASPWNLQGLGPYYDTKRNAEAVVDRFVAEGLDAVIVNPGYMFGPWDVKPTSGTMILEAARSPLGIPIYTAGGNSFCDVEAVADGHIAALAKGRTGERYILAGHNLPYREAFALINEVLGKPAPKLPVPAALGPVLGPVLDGVGYFAQERFDNFNSSTLRSGAIGLYADSGKAVRELGYELRPLRDAILRAKAWFEAHGYLKPSA